jgi:hypothetical protein
LCSPMGTVLSGAEPEATSRGFFVNTPMVAGMGNVRRVNVTVSPK